MNPPFLSVIIPAYNEEERLPETLRQVFDYLHSQPYSSEVLVVENGSQDRTLEVAFEFASQYAQLRVLHEDGRGKGLAVRSGMLQAAGEYRFMADADLSMPVDQLVHFLPPELTNFDVAIASREASGAIRYNETSYRHLGGRLINLAIRILALPGLQDTQCGFKCFRAPVADELFSRMSLTGWSFDVEILYIARLSGFRIVEIPIPWYFSAASKVTPVRDGLRLLADIMTIRRNARSGLYNRVGHGGSQV